MRKLLMLALAISLAACSAGKPPLVATDVSIRQPLPGMNMSAGYLTLTNNSSQTITITRVVSPEFASVAMHETVIDNDVSRMRALGELSIPPQQSVRFEPGGKHLMLMRPSDDIDTVTLEFYAGDTIILSISATFAD